MEIVVYSSLWVMQDLYHQPYVYMWALIGYTIRNHTAKPICGATANVSDLD